jgi:L-ribulose-5-phosphate 3-epimerase
MMASSIQIGMNGRFFPDNKQTARDEIVFAKMAGFRCIQFPGMAGGLDMQRLGDPLNVVGLALRRARITAVMEMTIPLYNNGLTVEGDSPLDILHANLQAIQALNCVHVHWHLVSAVPMTEVELQTLEENLVPQMAAAVVLAKTHRFTFGFEHNAADEPLFHRPEICADLLTAVPGLGLVWDINHTTEADLPAYARLAHRVTLLHISDTPWPDVNYHLPLGQGNLDVRQFLKHILAVGFLGCAVLEIGGMPNSGGYGRDTNEALIDSHVQLSRHVTELTQLPR